MPAIFVHGVPDTSRVWHRVLSRLPRRDVITLSLPGFGTPLPEGFQPTKEGYADEDAAETAKNVDARMKACILTLYRSAVCVGHEWLADLARITAPGVVFWGENDPYAASRFGARLAERTRARFVPLPGCSHWWQLERPDEIAAGLQALWAARQ